MTPALVLLAAGASRRLGACKALVDLGGRTPLARLLAAGADMDGAPPLVVAGPDQAAIARAAPPGVEVLVNARWSEGRTTSCALAARARAGLDLCFAPVDVPLVPREVFAGLATLWRARGGPRAWLQPRRAAGLDGAHPSAAPGPRFGHPVVVGAGLCRELSLLLDERGLAWKDFPLRAVRERAEPLLALDCDTDRILDDLDTPEDLERLRRLVS
ncbi:MAG: NTP transferase domain-containing protein [Planctomycetes bacterium]|nr:NTP transferase domain-containing protein [Planctomycetota bacterium]